MRGLMNQIFRHEIHWSDGVHCPSQRHFNRPILANQTTWSAHLPGSVAPTRPSHQPTMQTSPSCCPPCCPPCCQPCCQPCWSCGCLLAKNNPISTLKPPYSACNHGVCMGHHLLGCRRLRRPAPQQRPAGTNTHSPPCKIHRAQSVNKRTKA